SRCGGVGYTQLPKSHTFVCALGCLHLPPSHNENYLGEDDKYLRDSLKAANNHRSVRNNV
ncbi:hypothetical protein, partial [Providencia sp. PROV136]|uniref:hypothetical protein n=1 Tax=Providencia sp. PROV136 TaxID=2949846 RepID=UPI00234A0659